MGIMGEINIKKNIITRVIQAICFLLVLFTVLSVLSVAFYPKDNTVECGIKNARGMEFYSEPKDSIDVLFMGNSDAYAGFSPLELWNKYGYTSFVCAEGRLLPVTMYYYFKDVLSCQSPKVLVIETDCLFYDGKEAGLAKKISEKNISRALPVFQYHNMWKRTTTSNAFAPIQYTSPTFSKGQHFCTLKRGCKEVNYLKQTTKMQSIPAANDYYVNKILEIANKRDIKVIFAEVPSASSWTYEKHNGMVKYAKEKNIKFIDLDFDKKKFKFSWKKDTQDMGNHLNCSGARKVTLYFAKYLTELNVLSDHRTESGYSSWNDYYNQYKATLRDKNLKNAYRDDIISNNDVAKKRVKNIKRIERKSLKKNKVAKMVQ